MSDTVVLTDDHPVDPDDEMLVAYLDGELSDKERKLVEKRLVDEERFRGRLQALQTGWDWLDDLPEESADENLVASTIELVVTDIAPATETSKPGVNRPRKRWVMVGLCILGLVGGVVGVGVSRHFALQRELAQLAVVEHLDAYKLGETDFDFIRELADNPRWQKMLAALQEVGEQSIAASVLPRDSEGKIAVDAIKALSPKQRLILENEWETFQRFEPGKRHSIEQMATMVSQQQDETELLKTLDAYAVWYASLDDKLQDGINSSDPLTREQTIEKAIDSTMERLVRRSGTLISDETADRLLFGMQFVLQTRVDTVPELKLRLTEVATRIAEFTGSEPDDALEIVKLNLMRRLVEYTSDGQRFSGGGKSAGFAGTGFGGKGGRPEPPDQNRSGKREGLGSMRDSFFRRLASVLPEITERELIYLEQMLDDQALADLQQLTDLPSEFERQTAYELTLRLWSVEVIRRRISQLEQDDRSLLEKYLAFEEQDRLDLLEPAEIMRQLKRRQR